MADVFTALYFSVLNHDSKKPDWSERDRLILSNGHICPILYASLAHAGYFDKKLLKTLRKLGSPLQGHPHLGELPGVENTSGSLGQGLSQAAGMALAFKMDKKPNRIYCITSDGEHQEGQTWEAYMFSAKYRLSNLTVLVDRNNIQIDGFTEDIMPLQPLKEKIESFGWQVLTIDGHNIEAIIDACHQANSTQEQPSAIICNTIPGEGVDFMENVPKWHGDKVDKKTKHEALEDLRSMIGKISYD